jgi:glyoxylase-like metal-dependent hydrolase (beta-lactamase superfamily II)
MIMFEVLKDVYSLDHSENGNHSLESWILNCKDGIVLIDGGMTPKAIENIQNGLEELDKNWNDVKLILITHKHGDHIKNLPKLVELTGASVKSEEHEAPLIKNAVGVEVEGLKHGEIVPYCGGIQVIHIPGHSEGNASYLLKKRKAIIAGDTIFGDENGTLSAPPERYCLDVEQATKEIKQLLDYDFEYLMITHGKDILESAKEKVKKLVKETS